MKKKFILRTLLWFPLGLFISTTLSLIISLAMPGNNYLSTSPTLITSMGGATQAALLQYLLSGFLGASIGGLSLIWDVDSWSISKRTFLHFIGMVLIFLPVSYLVHWMPPGFFGILLYLGIFIFLYFSIWLGQYIYWRQYIKHLRTALPGAAQKQK